MTNYLFLILIILFITTIPKYNQIGSTSQVLLLPSNMSLTLEDFLKASKEQEEKRSAEREQERARDQQTRASERAEDLEKFANMIKLGVKEEVSQAIKPIVEQQKQFEDSTKDEIRALKDNTKEKIRALEANITDIKEIIKAGVPQPTPQTHPPYYQPRQQSLGQTASNDLERVKVAISAAKKVIYLQPIYKDKDVARQYRMHDDVENDDQAMMHAVKEYLRDELKVKEGDMPPIVRVFPPAGSHSYERLYVEFGSEHTADYISSFAQNLRKPDHHVGLYFPRMFQARFRALSTLAKNIREAPGLNKGDMKTKVVYGTDDIHLLARPRDGRWGRAQICLDDLPPILVNSSAPTSSPPQGRNRDIPVVASKRQAGSPLGSTSKSHRLSEVAEVDIADDNDEEIDNSRRASLPATLRQADRGFFGHTAVSSPKLISPQNKDFTFGKSSSPNNYLN